MEQNNKTSLGNRKNKNNKSHKIIPIILVMVILTVVGVVEAVAINMMNSPDKPQMENHTVATGPISPVLWQTEIATEPTSSELWQTEIITEPITEATAEPTATSAPFQTHTHNWQDATCTSPRICLTCGETEGNALDHDWIPATCMAPFCQRCGTAQGTALEHNWAAATRYAPKTCLSCGITEGDPLPSVVYLNEMPYSSKYGKLWTRSETPLDVTAHSKADHPGCWSDMDTPGHTLGPVLDCRGNVYKYGLHLDGDTTATYYISYNLDGMYTTFSGTCAYPGEVISTQWSPHYSKNFLVYADGELLYTASQMNKDTPPASFLLNVSGVKELRIVYPASDGPNEVATLFDGRLE